MKSVSRKSIEIVVNQFASDIKKVMPGRQPNVGKSVIFRLLTGQLCHGLQLPGTTVEVSRGRMRVGDILYEVI